MRLALPARPYYAGILQQHERGGNEVSREYGQQRAQINLHFADDERGEHEDALTGLLNKTYMKGRLLEMQETAPAAVICANINDWKFVYDHFGNEESDRLIKTVAGLIRKEAKEEYLIGRVDGDVFEIVIPTPEDGEAEAFCDRIQQACTNYEDPYLAPSLAIGLVYRTNVEESFDKCYSDAEYEMCYNKLDVKHADGYKERLEHGLK